METKSHKTEEPLRGLQEILNKMTPQNFEELVQHALNLSLDTEERLKAAVELIFDNFMSDECYDVDNAILSFRMLLLSMASKNTGGCLKFRSLLLTRCQSEIQKKHLDRQIQTKQQELDTANNQADHDFFRSELEELRSEAQRRFVSNMKLIGELFNIDMLREVLMHVCVMKLLKDQKEESLEGLCMLLQTVGKKLDSEKSKTSMDKYFSQIEKIANSSQTSRAITMMLQDVLDLRNKNWVLHQVAEEPKEDVIVECHKVSTPPSTQDHSPTPPPQPVCSPTSPPQHRSMAPLSSQHRPPTPPLQNPLFVEDELEKAIREEFGNFDGLKNDVPLRQEKVSEKVREAEEDELEKAIMEEFGNLNGLENDVILREEKVSETVREAEEDELEKAIREECIDLNGQENDVTLRQEKVSEKVRKTQSCSEEELKTELDRLLGENGDNQEIIEWIQTNLDEGQAASTAFVRALMTSVCQSVVVFCGFHKVDHRIMMSRSALLRKYLDDHSKQLEALSALQDLIAHMEHPKNLLCRLFVSLFDEEIVEEEVFLQWRFSIDTANQPDKETVLESVKLFFSELQLNGNE